MKLKKLSLLGAVLLLFMVNTKTLGQVTLDQRHNLNFFFDCEDCDFNFVRQELKFISFVRDRKLADVHVLLSNAKTGSGGKKYFISCLGLNTLAGKDYEYEYIANQMDTEDAIRRGLLLRLKTAIVQYYSKIGYFDQLEINLTKPSVVEKIEEEEVKDPWNKWVFNLDAGGNFQTEKVKTEYAINSEFKIKKVTENWKTKIGGKYNTDRESYIKNDEKIISNQIKKELSANYVKSLTSRWSVGLFGDYKSDTYINTKSMYRFHPGIEFNIFPWDLSNRKVFTFRYDCGVNYYDYNQETIYNKSNETRLNQSLVLELLQVQPWGTIEASLKGQNYFFDFTKNSITLDTKCSVRLSKQFSIYGKVESQVIHDQLYLPKGDASLEDILLKRQKLASTYEVSAEIGLSFTFGSIFNNIINQRL